MADSDVRQGKFNHGDYAIYQTLVMTKDSAIFKLVIPQPAGKSFQIDYVIPFAFYKQNLEAIESSIGSIAKL